jgi:hypothetical protein
MMTKVQEALPVPLVRRVVGDKTRLGDLEKNIAKN